MATDSTDASIWRRLQPWGFPAIYLGWAYLFWGVVVASGESVWSSRTSRSCCSAA